MKLGCRRALRVALAAPLVLLPGACGGGVEQGEYGDQSVSQPDDIVRSGTDAGGSADSALGEAARPNELASDSSACESFTTQGCRVRMRYGEGSGAIDTTLEVRRVDERRLSVTDGPDSESPWEVIVDVGTDGMLQTSAGVPALTCDLLVEDYVDAPGAETYEQVDGYPCSEADAALIRFFVREWFYFG